MNTANDIDSGTRRDSPLKAAVTALTWPVAVCMMLLVAHLLINGTRDILSGWASGWARPDWKDGVMDIYLGVVAFICVGSVSGIWSFQIAPNWPFRLANFQIAVADYAETHGPDDWYALWKLERVLVIRAQYYSRIRLFATISIAYCGLAALHALMRYRPHSNIYETAVAALLFGAAVPTLFSELRQKLRKVNK